MKHKHFILPFVLVALIAVTALAGCNGNHGGLDAPPSHAVESIQEIGQGETVFRLEITAPDGTLTAWDVNTNEETVGAALLAVGLIGGEETEFGLFVTEVNGVSANFDVNGAFWGFFIDGAFAITGVDTTAIESGVTYAFVYTQD